MRIGGQIGPWKTDDVEAAIQGMGKAGLEGIETFTTHLEPHYDDPAGFSRPLKDAAIELSGAYFNSTGFVDPAAENAVVDEAAKACRFLAAVGGGFLVVNGGVSKGDPPRSFSEADFCQLAKVLDRIGETATASGVEAVMHPHLKCMIETLADVDRVLACGLDKSKIGLCVHAAHQFMVGADPYEIYEKHGDWVRYAHIGNAGKPGGCLVGEGALDQERLMKPLLEAGFDGWIIIECGKKGVAPADYAADAIAYMKSTWPDVSWGS